MVDHPLGLALEESAARVYVDLLILHQCPVTSLRILPSCMEEEASSYGFSDLRKFPAGSNNIQLVSVDIKHNLITFNVLSMEQITYDPLTQKDNDQE